MIRNKIIEFLKLWFSFESSLKFFCKIFNYINKMIIVFFIKNGINKIIFIATTNYPERLDARIINRPSRFDLIVKIDLPNAEARALYLRTCLGKTQTDDGIDLVERTSGLTFAHLRELIVSVYCLDYPAEAAIERLQHMKVKPKSSELSGAIGFDGESEEAWKCYISNAVKKDTRNSDGVDP